MNLLVFAIIAVTFARVVRIFREADKEEEEEEEEEEKKDAPLVDKEQSDARAGEPA
jgi:Sec-independent protein translocase protein TatA